MEYIKLLGAALVILAGAGFGACPVRKMKQRIKETEGLYFCLLRLKSEIGHGVKTLPEAISSATNGEAEKRTGVYERLLFLLGTRMKRGGNSYETLLRECSAECFPDSVITKEEQDTFFEVFFMLGGADREKQIQVLEFYCDRIRLVVTEEKQKRKERSYVYRSLGILGGIFLAVILY